MAFDWFVVENDPAPKFGFRCSVCDEFHNGSPSFGYEHPHYFYAVPEAERARRILSDEDSCIIDGRLFLIRTVLEIPIAGVDEPFTWGVWVTQSEASFTRYCETFDQDQSGLKSFGWLPVVLPSYTVDVDRPDLLACDVIWGATGQRPTLKLHPANNMLYEDQRYGITWTRAMWLACHTLHGI